MMKRFIPLILLSTSLVFTLSDCSDDEKVPQIGFQTTASTVTEGNSVTVTFSMNLPNGVSPELSLSGTATQNTDYTFSISSSGITFNIRDDEFYDPNESIVVTITGFDGNAQVAVQSVHTITITDIDESESPGLQIDLTWNAGSGGPGNVDMDLFLWYENPPGSGDFSFVDGSFNIGPIFEQLFFPSVGPGSPDGIYGLGYNYYEGSSNNLSFRVQFRSFKGNINNTSNRAAFNAVYTLANVNPWEDTGEFYLAQVFRKTGQNFSEFSPIEVPASGSRYKKLQMKLKEAAQAKRMQRQ